MGERRLTDFTARERIAVIMIFLGLGFGLVVTLSAVSGGHLNGAGIAVLLATYGFLAFWLTMVVRAARTGLYDTGPGLRIRSIRGTRTVPWSDIANVHIGPSMWGRQPIGRDAIWLTLVSGERVETPVQREMTMPIGMRRSAGQVYDELSFTAINDYLHSRCGR